jgi:hypothetical protein
MKRFTDGDELNRMYNHVWHGGVGSASMWNYVRIHVENRVWYHVENRVRYRVGDRVLNRVAERVRERMGQHEAKL